MIRIIRILGYLSYAMLLFILFFRWPDPYEVRRVFISPVIFNEHGIMYFMIIGMTIGSAITWLIMLNHSG